jgi:hypothetical protein
MSQQTIKQGTIKRIDGRHVWISFAPLACCSGQDAVCHCADATAQVEFKALNQKNLNLSQGDYVEVSNPSGAALGGIVRLLVIPAVLLGLGWAFFGPLAGALAAVAGLGASILFPQDPDSGFPKVEKIVPVGDFTPFTLRS